MSKETILRPVLRRQKRKNVVPFPNLFGRERRRYAEEAAPRLSIIRKSISGDDVGLFCRIVEIPEERWRQFEDGERLIESEDLISLMHHLKHVSSDYILLGRTGGANDNERPSAKGVEA